MPFRALQPTSNYHRAKSAKAYLPYVGPVEFKSTPAGSLPEDVGKYCYIPLLDSLKQIIMNQIVRENVFNKRTPSPEGVYCDIEDGMVYKQNQFFEQSNSIKIILYQDEFEIVNPLVSARKRHKLLAVYYSLGNMPIHQRSKMDSIQLVLLCKESYASNQNMDHIFEPLIRDLKHLEGVGIGIATGVHLRGSILCILGDNLGSNWIGGFVTNFSTATYVCRFCRAPRDKFLAVGSERCLLRTPSSYENCAQQCSSSKRISNAFGVKHSSIFNCLNYYHVCNPGLPPCLAHDLFEGIASSDLTWLYLLTILFHVVGLICST